MRQKQPYSITIIFKKINMYRFRLFVSSTLLYMIVFSSCEKATVNNPETPDPELEEEMIELKFSIKNLSDSEGNEDQEGYEEYNFLGYGYDVTGKYSHKASVKSAVINTPTFVQENPRSFDALRVLQSSFKTVCAADAEDFTKWLTGGTQDTRYFKGNITHPFPDTDLNSNQYIYGLYDSYIKYKRLTLYSRNTQLLPYLTTEFQADSRSLEPAELVKKYGTHVLLSLFTGAKLSLDYQAEYNGDERRKAVENSFRVGLNDCFGLFSGFLDPVDSTTFKNIVKPVIAFEAIGGDPSKIFIDETSISEPKVNRTAWTESISEDNARFIYFDGLENMLPISELIEDVKKKEEVKAYIEKYIKTSEVRINP